MTDVARAEGAAAQRLGRERFIWRFRLAALLFAAAQSVVEPGDDLVLTWVNVALFAASVAWTGLALRGQDPTVRDVHRVGAVAMATDVIVILLILANNLTDLSEPIYLIGVLALLEATIRWPGRGGYIGGVAAGLAAALWTVVVAHRTVDRWHVDYASMRAGTIIGLGIFLGAILRRMADQHDMLRGILDTTRDLIVVLAADGTILSVNAASSAMLGYSPGELVGQHFSGFLHPDDLQSAPGSPLNLPTDGPRLIERRAVCRDGSVRWLELNTAAIPGGTTMHVAARDITDRVEARRLVEESEQRFRSLFEHNTDAVFAFDLEGRFTMVNPATERVTGYSADELIGSSFAPLVHADDFDRVTDHSHRASVGEPQDYDARILDRDGRVLDLDVTNTPIVIDGEIVGVFGLAKDVTDRRRLERQLGHQATHDALTGLPNRFQLEATLEAMAAGPATDRTLLVIDLDRFKLVNDSLGHRSGDEVLVVAVERLSRSVREGDLLGRWAGDEFCVLLAEGTSADTALAVADRLRAVLAEPFHIAGREVRLSASIGVARSDGGTGERLVQVADHAMYEAKRAGRDRVSVYVPGTERSRPNQIDIETDLRHAIDRRGLVVHYQPIVDTGSSAIVGLESLVRWPRSDGTLRPPDEFVPVAEESGLIRHLTRFVLEEVCEQLATWDRELGTPRTLQAWVNVSVSDLEAPRFAEEVATAARRGGVTPDRLVLEVTETMLMRDIEQVGRSVDALRRAGVSLAIDDFGTGYSSMSQLHRLEVTACKIDRSFVSGAPEHQRDAAILRALVDVGSAFGFPVVAEGVERPEELQVVQDIGCPLAQGFLLARPAPAGEIAELLRVGKVELATAVRSGR